MSVVGNGATWGKLKNRNQKKKKKKRILKWSANLNFKNFPFGNFRKGEPLNEALNK